MLACLVAVCLCLNIPEIFGNMQTRLPTDAQNLQTLGQPVNLGCFRTSLFELTLRGGVGDLLYRDYPVNERCHATYIHQANSTISTT